MLEIGNIKYNHFHCDSYCTYLNQLLKCLSTIYVQCTNLFRFKYKNI